MTKYQPFRVQDVSMPPFDIPSIIWHDRHRMSCLHNAHIRTALTSLPKHSRERIPPTRVEECRLEGFHWDPARVRSDMFRRNTDRCIHKQTNTYRDWLTGTWTLLPSLYKETFVKEHFSRAGAPPLSSHQSQLIINSVNFCHLSAVMHQSTRISFTLYITEAQIPDPMVLPRLG